MHVRNIPSQQPSDSNNNQQPSTLPDTFGYIKEAFKIFQENTPYNKLDQISVEFDSKTIMLEDIYNIHIVLEELNHISRKIFIYGVIAESQQRVVQLLEDEFEIWKAQKYVEIDNQVSLSYTKTGSAVEKKVVKTATAIQNEIIALYSEEYKHFLDALREEKYKLGLIKRVLNSLDNYSYKLHAICNHLEASLTSGKGL